METWWHNVGALAEHHRVFAVDLPGFGLSDKPLSRYSDNDDTPFIKRFMESQGIPRASMLGHSMGGTFALGMAIDHPEMVDKLILEASAGLSRELTLRHRLATLPLVGELLYRSNRERTERIMRGSVHDPSLITDDMVDFSHRMANLPGVKESTLATLRSGVNLFGLREDVVNPILDNLGSISAPTLMVWGDSDHVVPIAGAYAAEKRIPNARLHVFEKCGHAPHFERIQEFNALVLDFLAGRLQAD
jgi:4,5:9,10-diseco-3-hydroxy-5,9,17-trioxoandrosta-1(10),2-diene-4-oate hydrolase